MCLASCSSVRTCMFPGYPCFAREHGRRRLLLLPMTTARHRINGACGGPTPHCALRAGSANDVPPIRPRVPNMCSIVPSAACAIRMDRCLPIRACPDLQSDRSEAPLTDDDGWMEVLSGAALVRTPSSHSKQTKWRSRRRDIYCTSLATHPQSLCWWCALCLGLPIPCLPSVPPRLSFGLVLRLSPIVTADSAARAFLSRIHTYKTPFCSSSRWVLHCDSATSTILLVLCSPNFGVANVSNIFDCGVKGLFLALPLKTN
ncbi:hypothetical protein DFH08DRAFT_442669 [Mycena albidolilacea]|uniref:Uncharacterized protein n=1 Tax=Mycena albidolilacea TaxID=1033008 RepID=A0AAD7AH31_9AGAR|nr:hypothetical protein DFH08DRAFT_442669 [Mycena albidolilacea]